MTREEMQKKWPSEILAACIVEKTSLYAQKVSKKKEPTEAEKRHALEITRYQSLLLQYGRGRA